MITDGDAPGPATGTLSDRDPCPGRLGVHAGAGRRAAGRDSLGNTGRVSREQRAAWLVVWGVVMVLCLLSGSVVLVLLGLVVGVMKVFVELQRAGKWR